MKALPRDYCGLIRLTVCGVVAAAWVTTAAAQVQSNPLRIAAAKSEEPAAEPAKPQPRKADGPTARQNQPVGSQVRQTSYEIQEGDLVSPQTPLPEGTTIQQDDLPIGTMHGDMFLSPDGMAMQKGGGVIAGDCGTCGGVGCLHCYWLPCPISLDYVELFGGVQGFSGPVNRGGTGSFGFNEGFNAGMPFPCTHGCVGMQAGLRATQSNFSGAGFPTTANESLFTDEGRNQLFLTGGLFRRVDWGLQGGVVLDYLSDDWYVSTDLLQIRGEASWVFPCRHEFGFWFAASTESDTQLAEFTGSTAVRVEEWIATDLYAFFYRHRFDSVPGAECRLNVGWSSPGDGLIGADLRLPLSESFALETGVNYLIPNEAATGAPGGGHEQESWNLAINVVWYPGCRSAYGGDYFRPLFNVADNGSFKVDRN